VLRMLEHMKDTKLSGLQSRHEMHGESSKTGKIALSDSEFGKY
jgi:hypothetical protein